MDYAVLARYPSDLLKQVLQGKLKPAKYTSKDPNAPDGLLLYPGRWDPVLYGKLLGTIMFCRPNSASLVIEGGVMNQELTDFLQAYHLFRINAIPALATIVGNCVWCRGHINVYDSFKVEVMYITEPTHSRSK